MTAEEVFDQKDGDVTKAYYEEMNQKGILGQLAVALFRAQKRSVAAKSYRRGKFRRAAYDVKNWSLGEVCRVLAQIPASRFAWGWKRDPKTPGFEWVLYVELPSGQCSFHSADRLEGPDYSGEWDGVRASRERILRFCDAVAAMSAEELSECKPVKIKPRSILSKEEKVVVLNPWDRMKQELLSR